MKTTLRALHKGTHYDTLNLIFAEWTPGDGTGHEGYSVNDYFTMAGRYLGPDEHGIEPLFKKPTTETSPSL